jgi:hypothetical protein
MYLHDYDLPLSRWIFVYIHTIQNHCYIFLMYTHIEISYTINVETSTPIQKNYLQSSL